jgi:GNAT superfamily N-acetyltransferase
MTLAIRSVTPEDAATLLHFIKELAIYEREPDAVVATEDDIIAHLFGPQPRVFAVIIERDQQPIGFALYFYNFSTWLGAPGLFLEDLFVLPEHRGLGAGKALLQHLAQIAVANRCGRFEWNVLRWNQPAIDFYESFGARPQSEWVGYRLEGAALAAFAEA